MLFDKVQAIKAARDLARQVSVKFNEKTQVNELVFGPGLREWKDLVDGCAELGSKDFVVGFITFLETRGSNELVAGLVPILQARGYHVTRG